MKKSLLYLFILLAGVWTISSCQKDEKVDLEQEMATSEDVMQMETFYQDTDEEVDAQLQTRGGGGPCPIVTVTPDDGTYPRTVTIDYGTDGCEGPQGHIRKGIIVVEVSDTLSNPGAVRTVTFVDFFVDDVQLTGTRVLTNLGFNDNNQLVFNRSVVDGALIFPDGATTTWTADHTITQVEGSLTNELFDDVFEITGNFSGTNRFGNAFEGTILEPLVKPRTCPWIVSGVRELTTQAGTRTLDYGDGACDKLATLTGINGNVITVTIRRWW